VYYLHKFSAYFSTCCTLNIPHRFYTLFFSEQKTNKCVSRLARRKSYHTSLSNAAAPSSECPASVVRNSESPNEPRCTPPPMSPLVRQEMGSSAGAAGCCYLTLAASAYHSHAPVWVLAALSAFLSLVTLTFDL